MDTAAAMILRLAVLAAAGIFPLSEIVIGRRHRAERRGATITRGAHAQDQGSLWMLVAVICVAIAAAILLRSVAATRIQGPQPLKDAVALALLAGGMTLRWISIATLGRFFTVDVAVHDGQPVIDRGPYRLVRHPSYTGLLLSFAGLGVFYGNWLSIAALLVPISIALGLRIRVEERVLRDGLGAAYERYCARTRRLVPFVY